MQKYIQTYKIVLVSILVFIAGCSSDSNVEDHSEDILVESMVIYGDNITDGGSSQLSIGVTPNNVTNKKVTWSVLDTSVALISETGLLTAVSNGEVMVKAIAKDGFGISIEKELTISGVTEPPVLVESITISGNNITDGSPQQLSVEVLPSNTSNKSVAWSVSKPALADITDKGLLTPKINGTITITATATDGTGKFGELVVNISGLLIKNQKAENVLAWQKNNGGWSKEIAKLNEYATLSESQIQNGLNKKGFTDTTIDNEHTVGEIRILLSAYKGTNNSDYLYGAVKGIDYLLEAQYDNGGWPQYYPDTSGYRHQITFNDNAMVNVMNLMWDISKSINNTEIINSTYVGKAITSFNKGIDIILQTQITVNGKRAGWCAQHDEVTLLPAEARSYELPSLSGSESVGVIRTLMLLENPSSEVIEAITGAVEWFEDVKLLDIATQNTGGDVIVVSSPGNVIWTRFYDLDTNLPFFCGRDGVKKNTLAEIELERRTGYAWYGNWPKNLISSEYTSWKNKHGI